MTTGKAGPVPDDFDGIGWREYMRGIENGNIDPTGVRLRAVCKIARENLDALVSDAQSVRDATIEECAKLAESLARFDPRSEKNYAKAIRAIAETKPAPAHRDIGI